MLGVYTGATLAGLMPVGTQEFPCGVSFPAAAGETYWIAVDGEFDEGSGKPALRSFDVFVTMQLPIAGNGDPGPGQGSSTPAADTTAPETTILKTSLRGAKLSASFSFGSSEPGSTFRCRLDGGKWGSCATPRAYKNLKPGRHTFRVAAADPAGNIDPSPAISRFQVAKPKAKRRGKARAKS